MSPKEKPEPDGDIWPPPPTQPPPTVAVPLMPPLRKSQVFGEAAGRMMLMGIALGAAGGAVFGLAFFSIFGAFFGAIYGLLGGLLLGLADGLVVASVTCLIFFPLTSARVAVYRNRVTIITVILTLAGAWTLSLLLFGSWGNGTLAGGDTLMALIPTAIATVASGVASRKVTKWYVTASGIPT